MQSPIDYAGPAAYASLVIPFFNAANSIATTLGEIESLFALQRGQWEVVFVNDGSVDDSPGIVAEWVGQQTEKARMISYAKNRGKGHAVKVGLLAATGAWRIFTDADWAYGTESILALAQALRFRGGVAVAARQHPQSKLITNYQTLEYVEHRHRQSRLFSRIVRMLLPIQIPDTQAGLKGMSAEIAERLLPVIEADRFEFDCELLTACSRLGINVAEVPTTVALLDRVSSVSSDSAFKMLLGLMRIARRWRRGIQISQLQPSVHEVWHEVTARRENPRQAA